MPANDTPSPSAGARADADGKAQYSSVVEAPDLLKALDREFKDLVGVPTALRAHATEAYDGRKAKLVLVAVQDVAGRSRAGLPLHLLDRQGTVLDRAFTSRTGGAILRFPEPASPASVAPDDDGSLVGAVRLFDGTEHGIDSPVTVPPTSQFTDLTIVLDRLPEPPAADEDGIALWPPPGVGTDPLTKLPSEFTPELCDAVAAKFSEEADSLFADVGKPNDFRSKRTPIIKRLSVVRTGQSVDPRTGEPRRYVVRLRQSWVFLGYTLGELAEVDALDPGAMLEDTVSAVERSVEQVDNLVQQARSFASSQLFDSLAQSNKIDTLVNVATSAEVSAIAGGFGFGVPGLFGGGIVGARASTRTGATTSTSVNASLDVTHALTTAQTQVNEAVHSATSTLRSLARTITSRVGRVSPLLSRVTNLMRWRVYENYAVSTTVEDVVELVSEPLFVLGSGKGGSGPASGPVFSAAEIAEYRRFFEPLLLDPELRAAYPALVAGVRTNLTGGTRVTSASFEVEYSASLATGTLRIEVNGASAEARLLPGATRTRLTVRFEAPVLASAITSVELQVSAVPDVPRLLGLAGLGLPKELLSVEVTGVSVWAGSTLGNPPDAQFRLEAQELRVSADSGAKRHRQPVAVPPVLFDEKIDPLWLHVNANPRYYLGVLAQAGLYYPSLRHDSAKLAGLDGRIWRLPVLGFEAERILFTRAPQADSADDVAALLDDPGAATLVQIAAPGAYSEALQGLLALADAQGLLHPDLLPAPAPAMPPLALVDMTGKRVVPVDGDGSGGGLGSVPAQAAGGIVPAVPAAPGAVPGGAVRGGLGGILG